MFFSIDKYIIGVSARDDITDRDAGFFFNFTPGTIHNCFTELKMPARKLPGIFTVCADSLAEQKTVAIPYQDTNTYMRSFILRTVHDSSAGPGYPLIS